MLAPSHVFSIALIIFPLINVLTGPSCYLSNKPGLFRNFFISCPPFDPYMTTTMGDDMSTVVSEVDYYMHDRYTHKYHLSPLLVSMFHLYPQLFLMPRLVRLGFILGILFVV